MGKFNFIKTDIDGVVIIEPTAYGDDRGYFMKHISTTILKLPVSMSNLCRTTSPNPKKAC